MDQDIMKNMLKRETDRQFEIKKKKNEMKLIQPEHEQYHYFTDVFRQKLNEINGILDGSSEIDVTKLVLHFDGIWKELHNLQKFVADSAMFLRDYDIRVCQKNLQDAETKTRKFEDDLLPKKKFGFKNKRKIPVKKAAVVADHVDSGKSVIREEIFGFKDEENRALNLENDQLLKRDVSLQNLTKCLVKLNGAPSTLHATNLRDCLILCGPVATSVFAEYCTNCKFAVACQQLRVHSTHACDFYLHVTSKAIIEDSDNIGVATYNYVYEDLARDFDASTLDKTANNWSHIEDFNWLVADKQSPNWRTLHDAEQIDDWEKFEFF